MSTKKGKQSVAESDGGYSQWVKAENEAGYARECYGKLQCVLKMKVAEKWECWLKVNVT
jgi:hypothetical protein